MEASWLMGAVCVRPDLWGSIVKLRAARISSAETVQVKKDVLPQYIVGEGSFEGRNTHYLLVYFTL